MSIAIILRNRPEIIKKVRLSDSAKIGILITSSDEYVKEGFQIHTLGVI